MITRYSLFIILIFIIISCQKGSDTPQEKPGDTESYEGIIYSASGSGIKAFDLKEEKTLWEVAVKIADNNGIVYDDGVLYSSTPNWVSAVDATTGSVKWEKRTRYPINGNGFKSECRPVIKDSFLYSIMSGYLNHPTLICRNKNTGEEVWHNDIAPVLMPEEVYTTPIVVGDKVIGIGHDNDMPHNMIFCFNRFTGSRIWSNESIWHILLGYPFSPDSSQVIFLGRYGGGEFNSFDVNTGKVLWQASSPFGISPHLVIPYQNNRLLFPGYTMDNTGAFNLSSKKMEKTAVTDSMLRFTSHKENIYYIRNGLQMAGRNMETNQELWRVELPSKHLWDSIYAAANIWQYLHTSYITNLTTDGEIVYHFEGIYIHPKNLLNSVYLFDAHTGELKKEIKLTGSNPFLGKNLVLVKKGEVFYPTTRWAN